MNVSVLKLLVDTPTPTGSEHHGMMILGRYLKESLKDVEGVRAPWIDLNGCLHCAVDRGAGKLVMMEAHGDEIGFQVQYIDNDGFVYLQPIGGINVQLCPAERVVINGRNGFVNGVLGNRPPHLRKAGEKAEIDDLRNLPCDIGASNREEAEGLIEIGATAVVDSCWRPLAGTRVSARAFDNRVGAFAMCEAFIALAKSAADIDVHFVCTVGEEVGLVGGTTEAFNIRPDIGICCDVGFAGDAPKADATKVGDIRLGKGAALAIGPIYHPSLTRHFLAVAESLGIPVQRRSVVRCSGNNAWAMRTVRGGCAVAQVAIPLRYMHSPVEVIDLDDVRAVIELTVAAIKTVSEVELLPEQP